MSSTVHSKNYVYGKKEQTTFCSGESGTKNNPNNLVTLAAMDKIVSVNPPLAQPEPMIYFGAMDGEFGTVIKEKTKPGPGTIVQWLQTKANSDRIVSGGIGDIPNSEGWHFEEGSNYYDMFGVITKSLAFTLDGPNGKVLQTREVISTQLDETANDITVPAQATSAAVVGRNVTMTVDSITHTNLNIPEFTHSITIDIYDEDEDHVIGSDFILEPAIKSRTHVIGFNSTKRSTNTWFSDLLNFTIQKFTITIVYGSVVQFQYTNMTPTTVVEHNIPERGRVINDYGFIPTEDTVLTVSTPA